MSLTECFMLLHSALFLIRSTIGWPCSYILRHGFYGTLGTTLLIHLHYLSRDPYSTYFYSSTSEAENIL